MAHSSSHHCFRIVDPLYYAFNFSQPDYQRQTASVNLTYENVQSLEGYCAWVGHSEYENEYGKPMVWIGIYIALASLFCVISMGADLFHGFRNRKFWFPCKYFTLNAASITLIAIAMKLPVDLSLIERPLEQATKLGSMAFMCTMMANLMPSLASMDNDTLLANVIGLAILVITVIVNICIQISTGAITDRQIFIEGLGVTNYKIVMNCMVYSYVAISLWLLIMLISSAITIPACKEALEIEYQATTKRILNGQDSIVSTVEKLNQYLSRYWVMAESGSPQFVMASNPLSISSGILCVYNLISYVVLMIYAIKAFPHVFFFVSSEFMFTGETVSDYKWSTYFIALTQSIGVVVGSIAPIFRCFTIMNFKMFTKQNKNQFRVFKVEKYWIQKLGEWKESHLHSLSSRSRSTTLVLNLKDLFLGICISTQKIIVVSSKMMGLIPVVLLICAMYGSYWWKSLMSRWFVPPDTPGIDEINEDLRNYVLKLEDEMELGERTLKRFSNSIDHLIKKADKKQQTNLLMLLEKYSGFRGVENFDNDQVLPLISFKLVNSWSLLVVTLTCIAIALPDICNDEVDSLFKSVREGLSYTYLVEESLNNTREYGNIRKATMTLWHEVEQKSMWLENTLERSAYRGKTQIEILQWFADKAEEIVKQFDTTDEEVMKNTPKKLILANSMYRITRTILLNYQGQPTSEELFALLSSMIADILCACFTNIPRVIMMKCHGSAIEKRQAGVNAAAKLFGSTKEVVKRLDAWELLDMDPDKMAFIDEWHFHMKQLIP